MGTIKSDAASAFAQMAKILGAIKPLRDDIVQVVQSSDRPLTCNEITLRCQGLPDKEKVRHLIGILLDDGLLVAIPAKPGQGGSKAYQHAQREKVEV